jgi:bifunctional non-homologous end joining protein LigD
MDKKLRTGKVLLDWSQNDRHKSTVAAYSLRAKLARPTVSLPLPWEALEQASGPDDLLIAPQDALDRVEQHGDFFAPVLVCVQHLPGS